MNKQGMLSGIVIVVVLLIMAGGFARAQGPQPPGEGVQPEGEMGIQAAASAPLSASLGTAPSAALGTGFTYQGQLKQGDNPVNGTCDFQFSLWDAAGSGSPPTGGNQIGSPQTKTSISVSNGYFTIPDLDFGADAFQGDARWLQIAVRCPAGSGDYTTLAPRQALTAAPYALGLRPGADIIGGVPGAVLYVYNNNTSGTNYGVYGQSASTNGYGVYGYAGASTGYAYGVYGRSASTDGYGVYGYASATSGTTRGVYGESASTNGIGVHGTAIATSGSTYGVYGLSNSPAGYGVYGTAPSCGVYGYAGASSGTTYGVHGQSASTDGRGVYGTAPAYGVYGYASASTGTNYGVYGSSASPDGYGVYSYNSSGVAIKAGGTGIIQSTSVSRMFVPGGEAVVGGTATSDVQLTFWGQGRVDVKTTSSNVTRTLVIPLPLPAVLYGQQVRIADIRVYYKTSNSASYIAETDLYRERIGGTYYSLIQNTSHRNSTTDTYYHLSCTDANCRLSDDEGFVSVRLQLYFNNSAHTITIGGVRVTLEHD